jgi:hypothetical protein
MDFACINVLAASLYDLTQVLPSTCELLCCSRSQQVYAGSLVDMHAYDHECMC